VPQVTEQKQKKREMESKTMQSLADIFLLFHWKFSFVYHYAKIYA